MASGDPSPVRRVVLVGFMASGKTSVARALAERLGWQAVDADEEAERRMGRSIAEVFRVDGEATFRQVERSVMGALLERDRVIVASGGGWPATPARPLEALPTGTLAVWLRVTAEEAVERASAEPGMRPLLDNDDPLAAARRLLAERESAYRAALLHLDTAGRTPAEIAGRIAAYIEARAAGPEVPPHDD
ncbi:MAG: shikimate kinase [Gemmatimonadetes bacterium]|nr:MAG: shikimate kinase [Gemmatimonadota bacterium]